MESSRVVMRQRWRNLAFLHYAVEPSVIQATLPPGLAVDTYPDAEGKEMAWIGIVPFEMREVRPVWAPAIPWLSFFPEFNVRTYVRCEGTDPGVWFYSLDAARGIACSIARLSFALPYFHAQMSVKVSGSQVEYASRRRSGPGHLSATVTTREPLATEPQSLEHFLVERYRLYAFRKGMLCSGIVSHKPYFLQELSVLNFTTDLPCLSGLPLAEITHTCFAQEVEVEVFPLRVHGLLERS